MLLEGEYVPSTSAWVREQIEAYEQSGGHGGGSELAALLDVVAARLLDVDMLPGVAGEDRRRRMPVVRRGDDDPIDLLIFEQFAEIRVATRGFAHRLLAFRQPATMHFGQRDHGNIIELAERGHVPFAHQAVTNEAEADAFVGTPDPRITRGR